MPQPHAPQHDPTRPTKPSEVVAIEHPSPYYRRELQGRLAGLTLPRQVLVLSVWPLLEQFMAYLVGTVDLALAGHLRPQQLQVAASDAMGVTSFATWLINLIHMAVGIGATALIARAVGGQHRRLANAALGQSLILAVGSGLAISVAVVVTASGLGSFAGLSGGSLAACVEYLNIVALAVPFSGFLMVGNACLRGAGDMKTPFVVMLVVNVINAAASILFVFGPGPIGGHGVAGIAAGTVVAWVVGAAILLVALLRGWGGVRLYLHRLWPHLHTLRRIVRVGGPNLLESVAGMWVANYLVLRIVGQLATDGMIGAHMIAIRIESLSFLMGYALGTAASTLTGQYLGLGDPRRARQAVMLCWGIAAGIMTAMGLVFIAAPEALVRVITDSPLLLGLCVTPIRIAGPIQVFFATQLVMAGALRGAGDTRATMWMTALSIYLVRLPAAYLLGVTFDLGLNGVWLALCGELVFRGVIFAARFWQGAWTRVQV